MSNEIDDLYLVQNGINDVVDTDHNSLVEAVNFIYDGFGGTYNFGNGMDGHLKLGAITNPTGSNVAVPSVNGTGFLTGTFYYKYSLYNLSGETLPTNASATVSVTGQQVKVSLPAQASNTNVTGFYIYRSADNSTYYRVGFLAVDNATETHVFYDNNPILSGTAPAIVNGTGNTSTASGIYHCRDATFTASQTLTPADSVVGLVIIAQDFIDCQAGSTIDSDSAQINMSVGAAIHGGGRVFGSTGNSTINGANTYSSYTSAPARVKGYGYGVGNVFKNARLGWYGTQGGGINTTKAGGSVVLIAKNYVKLNGTITTIGQAATAGTATEPAASGGLIYVLSNRIDRTGGTLTATGGAGVVGTSTTPSAGGGGGGVVCLFSNYLTGSATINVNGGAGASGNGSGAGNRDAAGGFGGDGADGVATTAVGSAGSVGLTVTDTLKNVIPLTF